MAYLNCETLIIVTRTAKGPEWSHEKPQKTTTAYHVDHVKPQKVVFPNIPPCMEALFVKAW